MACIFIFAYRVPQDYIMGNDDTRRAWQSWFAELGEDLLDMGKPAQAAETVGSCGNGTLAWRLLDHPDQQRRGSTAHRRALPRSCLRRRS